MARKRPSSKSDVVLGKKMEARRLQLGMTRPQLAKKINETFQQIERYEQGYDRIPMSMLEDIALALLSPVPKKLIRRIVFVRKLEIEQETELEELIELYQSVFDEDEE